MNSGIPRGAMRWSGNTGKAKIQQDILAIDRQCSIIDIGAVGPGPLDLWKDMPLDKLPIRITGVDPDHQAVERARALGLRMQLHALSGYDLAKHFPAESFDIGICTQVLEHVARPVDLLAAIRHVLKSGALLWLTVDSAHFEGSHHNDPLWKRWARPLAARFSERYYDFGLTEDLLVDSLTEAGFDILELRHCNLSCLKPLYAGLDDVDAGAFMPAWLDFEQELAHQGLSNKSLFRGIYVAAHRR